MSLYLVLDGDRPLWIAHESLADGRARIYVWEPQTGPFHYNGGTSYDYHADQDDTYAPLTRAEAEQAMREGLIWHIRDENTDHFLTRLRRQNDSLDPRQVLDEAYADPTPRRRAPGLHRGRRGVLRAAVASRGRLALATPAAGPQISTFAGPQ